MNDTIDHGSRAHARLSASGAERWMACTPSVALEETFRPKPASFYMLEGTTAHELSEIELYRYLNIKDAPSVTKLKEMMDAVKATEYYNAEMQQYVMEYVEYVLERYMEAKGRSKEPLIMLEQRFDLTPWVPESFGTADVMIISAGVLEVIDLKYGKGKEVSADYNPQMMLYALGALNKYDLLYEIDTVRMTIHQPRIDNISYFELPAKELYGWGERVKPVALKAFRGEGEFNPGNHCGFCKAKAVCKARADYVKGATAKKEQDPRVLSNAEIAEILHAVDSIARWVTDVKEHALDQAENHGAHFPGFKLVEGRSNRKIADPVELAERIELLYEDAEIWRPRELKTLSDLEKEIGKKNFEKLGTGLIVKPTGKPTLVVESDKRPEIGSHASAVNDFGNLED